MGSRDEFLLTRIQLSGNLLNLVRLLGRHTPEATVTGVRFHANMDPDIRLVDSKHVLLAGHDSSGTLAELWSAYPREIYLQLACPWQRQ